MNTSATDRLLAALQSGETLTSRQIRGRFKVSRGRKVVENLRLRGHVIISSPHVNSRGESTTRFSLGAPTLEMMAKAYRVLGANVLGMVK